MIEKLKQNWKSGLSVSLVSIPLSISLAIAGGATPIMGIITAIWAGLIAAWVGGSQYNIVGPTAALSGILALYAAQYGMGVLPILAILTGIVTLVVWVLGWDKYMIFIPSSAVHGFTLGVAFTIAFSQFSFNSAFGLTGMVAPKDAAFITKLGESFSHIRHGQTDPTSLILFLIGFVLMFVFLKYIKRIPPAIIVAVLGIIVGFLSSKGMIGLKIPTLFDKFGNLSPALAAFGHFHSLSTYFGSFSSTLSLVKAAIVIMIVAVLETLISAKIADGMTKTKFMQSREVLGLGLANIASGFFGGIPATAALARTSLNVKSGANSNYSGIINAVAVTLISFIFLPIFKYLPLPIIASILFYVAIRMVEREHFVNLYVFDKVAFWLSMVVAIITVVIDPITGILVGSAVALLILAKKFATAQSNISLSKQGKLVDHFQPHDIDGEETLEGDAIVYRFAGELTYINAQSHLKAIDRICESEPKKTLILNFRNLFYIDVDGLEALGEMVDELISEKHTVMITGAGNGVLEFLKRKSWFMKLQTERRVFESTHEALAMTHRA